MVVDFHVHPVHWQQMTPALEELLSQFWTAEKLRAVQRQCETPEGFAQYLRSQGVDHAVVLAEMTPTTGLVDNEHVLAMCRDEASLIPFGTLYPGLHRDLAGYLQGLAEQGMRGIKLYPTYNLFYPNDPMLYPMYAEAERLGLPVMVHTGTSVFPGSRIKYGDPLFLDDVAVDFPGLRIVLSHAGRPFWHAQAEFLARLHANVFLDLAGLPPKNLLKYLPNLPRLTAKAVFGSDWPVAPAQSSNLADLRSLPLPEEGIARIVGGNAARILGIEGGMPPV